jgi:hypothetical protein
MAAHLFDNVPDVSRIRNQNALIECFLLISRLSRNRTRACFAHNDTLGERLGCCAKHVSRLIERLRLLGVVAVEQVEGIERRVRPLCTLERLKAILFRGHESNRTKGAPVSHRSTPPAPAASFCLPAVPGPVPPPVPPVAEGHKRESVGLLTDSPFGGRTTTDSAPGARVQKPTPSVVVSSPSASSAAPTDPNLLASIVALGVSQAQAVRDTAGRAPAAIRQAVKATAGYLASRGGAPGAVFHAAIRDGWLPQAPPEPEKATERPTRVVRAPQGFVLGQREERPQEAPARRPLVTADDLKAMSPGMRAKFMAKIGGAA